MWRACARQRVCLCVCVCVCACVRACVRAFRLSPTSALRVRRGTVLCGGSIQRHWRRVPSAPHAQPRCATMPASRCRRLRRAEPPAAHRADYPAGLTRTTAETDGSRQLRRSRERAVSGSLRQPDRTVRRKPIQLESGRVGLVEVLAARHFHGARGSRKPKSIDATESSL